jgi:hypothetical protein
LSSISSYQIIIRKKKEEEKSVVLLEKKEGRKGETGKSERDDDTNIFFPYLHFQKKINY